MAHDSVLPPWCGHLDGCIYLHSANSRQLTCVCVSICVCVCIALWIQTDKGQQLCRPWFTCIWPMHEPGVKCDLSVPWFALCSENKAIYWVAHNTALFSFHRLFPLPVGCVVNITEEDIFALTSSKLSPCFLSYLLFFPPCSLGNRNLPLLQHIKFQVLYISAFSTLLIDSVVKKPGVHICFCPMLAGCCGRQL